MPCNRCRCCSNVAASMLTRRSSRGFCDDFNRRPLLWFHLASGNRELDMSKLKCGLIQMGLKGDVSMGPVKIRDKMIEGHLPLIDKAGASGVQVLCFQEIFT